MLERFVTEESRDWLRSIVPDPFLSDAQRYEKHIGLERHERNAGLALQYTDTLLAFLKEHAEGVAIKLKLSSLQSSVLEGITQAPGVQWRQNLYEFSPSPAFNIAAVAVPLYEMSIPVTPAQIQELRSQGSLSQQIEMPIPSYLMTKWDVAREGAMHSVLLPQEPTPIYAPIIFLTLQEHPRSDDEAMRELVARGLTRGRVSALADRILVDHDERKGFSTTKYSEKYWHLGELASGPYRQVYAWNVNDSQYTKGGLIGIPKLSEIFSSS